jgi:hypothetical protein
MALLTAAVLMPNRRAVNDHPLMEPPMIALMEPFRTGQKAVFGPASNLFKLVFFTPFQSVVFR